ncbi:unnamed protein product [Fraxinus pennsylvanica]|uniref:EF-hand domain-containing protein n=1 Tax=Fraxinus pennsylvanica TaxID=56036 RepID=A0AAD2DJY8_9LAMI|nr:unnamed protein product [Fraxinus pennsylvanica]
MIPRDVDDAGCAKGVGAFILLSSNPFALGGFIDLSPRVYNLISASYLVIENGRGARIDESLRKCKATFEEFDEDGNGAIDPQELKNCFHKLEISFTDEEIDDLFEACDINEDMGMKFNEFIVLLCLVYLLKDDPTTLHAISRMGMPNLEATFETLVDAFVFLDKNKDGYVSKNEMVDAINETAAGERSSGRIAVKRFEEMDWDRNGMVNFKEFLFAFTRWVGIEDIEDEGEDSV